MLTNVLEKAKKVLCNGLDFMEGREKQDIELGKHYFINEFGFLSSSDGEYVVFTSKDDSENFYFGGQVLTQKLKELEELLEDREMNELKEHGIEVVFSEKKSEKNRRKYTACEFIL